MVAPSRDHVLEDLHKIHFTITKLDEDPDRVQAFKKSLKQWQTVSLHSLALCTRQLATLLHAGVPMARSIDSLRAQPFDARLGAALNGIAKDLKEGYSLARSLSRQGNVFPSIYVSMVRAGEVSGAMDEILDRLAAYLEREYFLRKKVQSATTYPLVVFLACIGVTFMIVNFVFPNFVQLFEGLSIRLPAPTRAMIAMTHLVRDPAVVVPVLMATVFCFILARAYTLTPIGKRQWHQILLVSPVFGPLFLKVSVGRMCNTLGTMLDSGIPLLQALASTAAAVDNVIIADKIHDIAQNLKGGVALSVPMSEQRGFPPMLQHLVRAGEEAGNLSLMLRKMGQFMEEEVEYYIQSLISMMEPIMVLCMGILVGFVLLAVFMPVYSLVSQF